MIGLINAESLLSGRSAQQTPAKRWTISVTVTHLR
jgi:hypothetical protein